MCSVVAIGFTVEMPSFLHYYLPQCISVIVEKRAV